jgi:hypothetical protein
LVSFIFRNNRRKTNKQTNTQYLWEFKETPANMEQSSLAKTGGEKTLSD